VVLPKRKQKTGLWVVGASGGVGSTVALGLAALAKGLTPPDGLVTAHPALEGVDLTAPADIVFGGHDVRRESLTSAVRNLYGSGGFFDVALIDGCVPALRSMQRNLRLGTLFGAGAAARGMSDRTDVPEDDSAGDAVARLAEDLVSFRTRQRLAHVIVVHAASSEPPPPAALVRQTHGASLDKALSRRAKTRLPPSTIYALAAIEAGCAYVNFTPSVGIDVPAVRGRAARTGIAFMGSDGKTGETLVKSVLAPMFAMRNLPLLSWMGQNILGNRDGAVLNDPATREAKIRSKQKTVAGLAAGAPCVGVNIDYVPSLSDWKVAWDFIHFSGFMGTKMSLQFTWQGADSMLAAPLIIDLARLADLEMRRERAGVMRHLAFFFKDPMGCDDFNLFSQWTALLEHLHRPGG